MYQKTEYDQVTRESRKVTYIKVVEISSNGVKTTRDMILRHALMAMKVQPDRFKLADGEKLPKGISLSMVPTGTTIRDVEEFEKKRGTIGKATKTQFDNILDALDRNIELEDVEVIDSNKDGDYTPGSMMSENAPAGFVPSGVDLTPSEEMKDKTTDPENPELKKPGGTDENAAKLDEAAKTNPELNEIKETDLKFDDPGADATPKYTKEQLKGTPKDKLQAILAGLPGFKKKAEKMQKQLIKGSPDSLIETIVQLSKVK